MRFIKSIFGIICLLLLLQCKQNDLRSGSLAIIPYPVSLTTGEGYFVINRKTRILTTDTTSHKAAVLLAAMISSSSEFDPAISPETTKKNFIELKIEPGLGIEAYVLDVTKQSISIRASTSAGLFYGIQTLRQMLSIEIERKEKSVESWLVPVVHIEDNPTYSWRGMHLDVSRHFFPISFLKTFIDRLALYKFNTFHLHLTDDQGWRIEIKKYPELTGKGAWRKFNNQDSICMEKSIDNPDFALPIELIKHSPEGPMYAGYYTQEEIKELVKYASERFITIVPEIDMPGHMKAALNSYPELSCADGSGWGEIFSIPLCPCEESTYQFVENILTEVVELFPGEYVHIGGDEVDKLTWKQSQVCQELIKKEDLKGVDELQGYFVKRLEKFLKTKNRKMIGWDEVLEGGVDSATNIMYWRGWVADAPIKAAREHHNIIMSPTSHCYYDYEPDRTTLEKMYSFNPVPEQLTGDEAGRIAGVQANIWTEWIPTVSRLDYMTMPRMLALAEVAWAKPTSYDEFNKRLLEHYPRLDILKIKYRLPDLPALQEHIVFIDKATLTLEKPEAVKEIRYTTDGTAPTINSTLYDYPINIDTTTTFRLLTFGDGGRTGNTYIVRYEKQVYLEPTQPSFTGIKCRYFEGNSFSAVKDTVSAKFVSETVVNGVNIPDFCREDKFALKFRGYLKIPEDGIYSFYLSSDDGSVLSIGNRTVINHDGFHSSSEVTGQIALRKGNHRFELSYFESGGGNSVSVQYDGLSIKKRKL